METVPQTVSIWHTFTNEKPGYQTLHRAIGGGRPYASPGSATALSGVWGEAPADWAENACGIIIWILQFASNSHLNLFSISNVCHYIYYGQSGQAVKLFQIAPIRQWFPNTETVIGKIYGSVIFLNNPGSWQPVGASEISFTYHFSTSLSSLMMWNLQQF